jgi:DNA repair exonuclease SbcCD nuclease subunit
VQTLLWPGWSLANAESPARFSFIVVSDTHLGRNDDDSAARQWERTAREIDAASGDFVLHLGDIVDGGREAQYAVYRQTRDRIRKPVHEIPGNHDPAPAFQRHLRRAVDTAFDHLGVRFLLLNNSRRDSHDGFITPQQIGWLREQCSDAARRRLFLFLCMHVPAHDNRHPDRGWYVHPGNGQRELYELLQEHRQRVLALLHGHFHNGVRGWEDHAPLREICFPSALYNQDRRLAEQRAPGFYLAELRPGFVQVTLQANGMRLAYHPTGSTDRPGRLCPLPQLSL